jgi:hypothetical protein
MQISSNKDSFDTPAFMQQSSLDDPSSNESSVGLDFDEFY